MLPTLTFIANSGWSPAKGGDDSTDVRNVVRVAHAMFNGVVIGQIAPGDFKVLHLLGVPNHSSVFVRREYKSDDVAAFASVGELFQDLCAPVARGTSEEDRVRLVCPCAVMRRLASW